MKYKHSTVFGKDVAIIEPEINRDFRGEYTETWNIESYRVLSLDKKGIDWKQDDISVSWKNTLRGFHGDERTWKLISCVYGHLYQVIVDMRPESPTYLKWEAFTLNDKNRLQILIPPMFGNAHLVMSDTAIFHYKQSTLYEGQGKQFTIKWDDPKLNVFWPIQNPILSERDTKAKYI